MIFFKEETKTLSSQLQVAHYFYHLYYQEKEAGATFSLTCSKLTRLVYFYAGIRSLETKGIFRFDENFVAYTRGVSLPSVHKEFLSFGDKNIDIQDIPYNYKDLTFDEKRCISYVWNAMKHLPASEIENVTRLKNGPWHLATIKGNSVISFDTIYHYFKSFEVF